MVFSSPVFLFLFLPLTLLAVWLFGRRGQNIVLLFASLLFYAWGEGTYVLLMLATILVNHTVAMVMDRSRSPRTWLTIGITLDLAVLVAFKYTNFIADSLSTLLLPLNIAPIRLEPVHLPIGVSFYIFHSISYLVDIYRGKAKAAQSPTITALYITLFPQLVAGPIVRFHDVAKQFTERVMNMDLFASGVRRFIVGLAKKVLIADQCARIADAVFIVPSEELPFATAWLGAIAYAVQIYFDFSGYSDMAIGLGRMFGFQFLENFDRPYIARSVREFWRRWHISLSNWFRDYLYIPLGGNQHGGARTYFNLLTVFFLTGLWHGASWNFVVWGLVHGFFMIAERAGLGRLLERAPRIIGHVYTLLVVIMAWVLFRVTDLDSGYHYLLAMVGASPGDIVLYPPMLYLTNSTALALSIGILGAVNVHALIGRWIGVRATEPIFPSGMRGAIELIGLVILLVGVFMAVASSTYSPFIYFRF